MKLVILLLFISLNLYSQKELNKTDKYIIRIVGVSLCTYGAIQDDIAICTSGLIFAVIPDLLTINYKNIKIQPLKLTIRLNKKCKFSPYKKRKYGRKEFR